jgi:hypothetical protein
MDPTSQWMNKPLGIPKSNERVDPAMQPTPSVPLDWSWSTF